MIRAGGVSETGRDWKPETGFEAVIKWKYKRPELRQ